MISTDGEYEDAGIYEDDGNSTASSPDKRRSVGSNVMASLGESGDYGDDFDDYEGSPAKDGSSNPKQVGTAKAVEQADKNDKSETDDDNSKTIAPKEISGSSETKEAVSPVSPRSQLAMLKKRVPKGKTEKTTDGGEEGSRQEEKGEKEEKERNAAETIKAKKEKKLQLSPSELELFGISDPNDPMASIGNNGTSAYGVDTPVNKRTLPEGVPGATTTTTSPNKTKANSNSPAKPKPKPNRNTGKGTEKSLPASVAASGTGNVNSNSNSNSKSNGNGNAVNKKPTAPAGSKDGGASLKNRRKVVPRLPLDSNNADNSKKAVPAVTSAGTEASTQQAEQPADSADGPEVQEEHTERSEGGEGTASSSSVRARDTETRIANSAIGQHNHDHSGADDVFPSSSRAEGDRTEGTNKDENGYDFENDRDNDRDNDRVRDGGRDHNSNNNSARHTRQEHNKSRSPRVGVPSHIVPRRPKHQDTPRPDVADQNDIPTTGNNNSNNNKSHFSRRARQQDPIERAGPARPAGQQLYGTKFVDHSKVRGFGIDNHNKFYNEKLSHEAQLREKGINPSQLGQGSHVRGRKNGHHGHVNQAKHHGYHGRQGRNYNSSPRDRDRSPRRERERSRPKDRECSYDEKTGLFSSYEVSAGRESRKETYLIRKMESRLKQLLDQERIRDELEKRTRREKAQEEEKERRRLEAIQRHRIEQEQRAAELEMMLLRQQMQREEEEEELLRQQEEEEYEQLMYEDEQRHERERYESQNNQEESQELEGGADAEDGIGGQMYQPLDGSIEGSVEPQEHERDHDEDDDGNNNATDTRGNNGNNAYDGKSDEEEGGDGDDNSWYGDSDPYEHGNAYSDEEEGDFEEEEYMRREQVQQQQLAIREQRQQEKDERIAREVEKKKIREAEAREKQRKQEEANRMYIREKQAVEAASTAEELLRFKQAHIKGKKGNRKSRNRNPNPNPLSPGENMENSIASDAGARLYYNDESDNLQYQGGDLNAYGSPDRSLELGVDQGGSLAEYSPAFEHESFVRTGGMDMEMDADEGGLDGPTGQGIMDGPNGLGSIDLLEAPLVEQLQVPLSMQDIQDMQNMQDMQEDMQEGDFNSFQSGGYEGEADHADAAEYSPVDEQRQGASMGTGNLDEGSLEYSTNFDSPEVSPRKAAAPAKSYANNNNSNANANNKPHKSPKKPTGNASGPNRSRPERKTGGGGYGQNNNSKSGNSNNNSNNGNGNAKPPIQGAQSGSGNPPHRSPKKQPPAPAVVKNNTQPKAGRNKDATSKANAKSKPHLNAQSNANQAANMMMAPYNQNQSRSTSGGGDISSIIDIGQGGSLVAVGINDDGSVVISNASQDQPAYLSGASNHGYLGQPGLGEDSQQELGGYDSLLHYDIPSVVLGEANAEDKDTSDMGPMHEAADAVLNSNNLDNLHNLENGVGVDEDGHQFPILGLSRGNPNRLEGGSLDAYSSVQVTDWGGDDDAEAEDVVGQLVATYSNTSQASSGKYANSGSSQPNNNPVPAQSGLSANPPESSSSSSAATAIAPTNTDTDTSSNTGGDSPNENNAPAASSVINAIDSLNGHEHGNSHSRSGTAKSDVSKPLTPFDGDRTPMSTSHTSKRQNEESLGLSGTNFVSGDYSEDQLV